jgi:hypothetical protein
VPFAFLSAVVEVGVDDMRTRGTRIALGVARMSITIDRQALD